MQDSSVPGKMPTPWAYSAGTAYIRAIPIPSQASVTPGAASYTDGFGSLNATPVAAGGVPPFMQDFNGIFNAITSWLRWLQAGGPLYYDAAFSTAIGGYPKGAVVSSATLGLFWVSTIDNNTSNPDTGGAGWTTIHSRANTWTATQTYTSGIVLANNVNVFAQNTGGTAFPALGMGTDNYLRLYSGPTGLAVYNNANTSATLLMDNIGNGVFAGGVASKGYDGGGANYRFQSASYGAMMRIDNTSTYLLLTNANSPTGAYNSLRPFSVNNATGQVFIDGTGVGASSGGPFLANRLRAVLGARGSNDGNAATILSDFSQSFSAFGYVTFPNGMIFQWGNTGVNTLGQGLTSQYVTLPVTFPTAYLFALATWDGNSPPSSGSCAATGVNTSTIQVTTYSFSAANYGVAWFAIGY